MAKEKKEVEVESVQMLDGRKVDFTGKTRVNKSYEVKEGEVILHFDFRNGESRHYTVPAKLQLVAAGHGGVQKFGDRIAGVDDLDDAIEAMDQLNERLQATGEWNAAVEGGSGMAGASILAKALVEVSGQTIAVVRQYLSGLDAKTKAALRLSAEVKPVVDRLEAEKAARAAARGKTATAIDTGSVLANLRAGLPVAPQTALPSAPAEEPAPM
jgi:hypothetical protein